MSRTIIQAARGTLVLGLLVCAACQTDASSDHDEGSAAASTAESSSGGVVEYANCCQTSDCPDGETCAKDPRGQWCARECPDCSDLANKDTCVWFDGNSYCAQECRQSDSDCPQGMTCVPHGEQEWSCLWLVEPNFPFCEESRATPIPSRSPTR